MTTNNNFRITKNQRLAGILLAVVLLLMIPLVAMQFTDEVNWDGFDFVVAGILLFGTGLTIEFILRKVRGSRYRLAIIAAVLMALFLVWAELSVGIFGSPFAGS